MKKVMVILSLVLVVMLSIGSMCFASGISIPTGTPPTGTSIDTLGGTIIGTIQLVGVIVAVAVLVFVGIKFMLASPSEKANIKGALIPYIVGAVLIFAASMLVGIIQNIITQ